MSLMHISSEFRNHGNSEARITNGLRALSIPSSKFPRFKQKIDSYILAVTRLLPVSLAAATFPSHIDQMLGRRYAPVLAS